MQLLRLRPAFEGCEITYATTHRNYQADVPGERFHVVPDCNRWQKVRAVWSAVSILILLLRVRPDVVISTGALPGFLAIMLGRRLGARTVWIDSVANAEELSLSGQKAGRHAHLWLTQWEHLARPEGPHFFGSVL